jgi:hypothetical protein
MKFYVDPAEMPDNCDNCPLLTGSDECILQDEDANFMADCFDDLRRTCPLLELPQ